MMAGLLVDPQTQETKHRHGHHPGPYLTLITYDDLIQRMAKTQKSECPNRP